MRNEQWLPLRMQNHAGQERSVGLEFEMAGLGPDQMLSCIQALFGGRVERSSRFEYRIDETCFGKFGVELDASALKTIGHKLEQSLQPEDDFSFEKFASEIIAMAAEQVVPWEITTPPIPVSQLAEMEKMVTSLRSAGALGTRSSLIYAFGLHFNPELPALDVGTILNYLRAFLCLFEWIAYEDDTDLTRRLTNYINHFGKPYILQVLDPDYQPDLRTFMQDYIEANPTRNRTLDLLPLFAWLDPEFVRNQVEDPRVKGRPTFHYRLPNCDIDNPAWALLLPWHEWLQVERLAADPAELQLMCDAYRIHLDDWLPDFDNAWIKRIESWVYGD